MLGPQSDGLLALDVIRTAYDPRWCRGTRVYWSGGWFRWANGWPITQDLAGAADLIIGTLNAAASRHRGGWHKTRARS